MPWELLDHQADVGLVASGDTLKHALTDGVLGMLTLMVNPEAVHPLEFWEIDASGDDPGALFVDLLNTVLAAKDIQNAFFHDITITALHRQEDIWHVSCRLTGERIDLSRHEVDSDVKAATYGGLLGEQRDDGTWVLRCVLDL